MKEDTNSIEAVAITARDVATAAEIFMVGMLCWVLGVGLSVLVFGVGGARVARGGGAQEMAPTRS